MGVELGLPVPGRTETVEDYMPDGEVRWCPGCGDFAVLSAVRELLPTLGIGRENTVFVSGIGCASRFPYYVDTYGLHTIHGRAPAIATGLAIARPDLSVWVVTGDGDGLSIGGNHLVHALRRNVNITILLFDNRIYGLTKGQYSPTSRQGKVTKSSPQGSVARPLNPLSLALGVEATFVARAVDLDRVGLLAVLSAAVRHRGAALVHILQDCPVFNPGEFETVRNKASRAAATIALRHGEPIRFGAPDELGTPRFAVVRDGCGLGVAEGRSVSADDVVVHDVADLELAFALSRLEEKFTDAVVTGVLRAVTAQTYDDAVREQAGGVAGAPDLQALLRGAEPWTVPGPRPPEFEDADLLALKASSTMQP